MAEGNMYIEKRKFKRAEAQFTVRYKLMPKDNTVDAIKKSGSGRDVSIGGVRVEGDIDGSAGDVIRLEFDLPGRQAAVVTFAEIKWIREINGINQFGLEFLALRDEDKEAIEKVVG